MIASSSKFKSVEDYNEYLIDNNKTDVTIKEYIVNIKNMFYPYMDISFMDFLIPCEPYGLTRYRVSFTLLG